MHAQKTQSRQSFSGVSRRREHCIREAASPIDLWNQGAISKNVSCARESKAESVDHAPAKPSPSKVRCIQTFKTEDYEKWPLVTVDEKGDTGMNSEVGSTVVK